MIKDVITNKVYEGKSCSCCGSDEVYIIHSINEDYPNDAEKDGLYCRCENCRKSVTKQNKLATTPMENYFIAVLDAINAWNFKN